MCKPTGLTNQKIRLITDHVDHPVAMMSHQGWPNGRWHFLGRGPEQLGRDTLPEGKSICVSQESVGYCLWATWPFGQTTNCKLMTHTHTVYTSSKSKSFPMIFIPSPSVQPSIQPSSSAFSKLVLPSPAAPTPTTPSNPTVPLRSPRHAVPRSITRGPTRRVPTRPTHRAPRHQALSASTADVACVASAKHSAAAQRVPSGAKGSCSARSTGGPGRRD